MLFTMQNIINYFTVRDKAEAEFFSYSALQPAKKGKSSALRCSKKMKVGILK